MNEKLNKLLMDVGECIRPAKERTLFSLGGRGHYENPVSDLLAFFMDPAAGHGLGTVFLSAFLRCLPGDEFKQLPLERVWISREEGTEERKRIDLVLRGTGWLMLIENKIYHWQANPFLEYKEHFTRLNGGTAPYMVVLSPEGNAKEDEWMGVSYEDYCEKLKEGLLLKKDLSGSKWLVFANELILHLENELYTAPMENKAIEFVEANWPEIKQVQKLATDYRTFLHRELKMRLVESLGDEKAWTKEDGWAIRCFGSRWGQANIAWWYDSDQPEQPISFTVYVPNPNSRQLELGKTEFESQGMEPGRESGGKWIGWRRRGPGYKTAKEAMVEFVRLSQVVDRMFLETDSPKEAQAEQLHTAGAFQEAPEM